MHIVHFSIHNECILYICCVHMQWVYMQQRVWNACGCYACRCKILQHTATRCNIIQRTAAHCNTLRHTATHCHAHRNACRCKILQQHTAAHCSTLQHTATRIAMRVDASNACTCKGYTCDASRLHSRSNASTCMRNAATCNHTYIGNAYRGVATISCLLKIIGLFGRILSLL